MGRHQLTGAGSGVGAIVRAGMVAFACLALAHCSAAPVGGEAKYSKRIVEEGEPVPKGGGSYRVGKPYSINGRTYIPHENPNYRVEGVASWYGRDFHGRLTANGEVYDMHGISAAHTTMPLPSYARVTNLENGRSIVVRVNDRGPYVGDRVIDLSIGTAKALNFHGNGLARVRVEYLGRAPIEGSDDRMLMATLREGSPAPAPSRVLLAAARPFIPGFGGDPPLPTERPFTLGSGSTSAATTAAASEVTSTSRQQPRTGAARPLAASAGDSGAEAVFPSRAPTSFTTVRSEAPALGLMSGRGLY
jgi:rare lipoprotein A